MDRVGIGDGAGKKIPTFMVGKWLLHIYHHARIRWVYNLLIRIIARLLIISSNDNNKSLKCAVRQAANM